MPWIYYLVLLAILLLGWFVNILTLPGLWLMVAGFAAYAWVTGWTRQAAKISKLRTGARV